MHDTPLVLANIDTWHSPSTSSEELHVGLLCYPSMEVVNH